MDKILDASRLIEGEVMPETHPEVERLLGENRRLKDALDRATLEAAIAKREAEAAIGPLRTQLTPLYRALQVLFGHMEAAGVTASDPVVPTSGRPPTGNQKHAAVWESWKQKLGPTAAKFIDALLLHEEMTVTQLRIACQCGQQTVYDTASKMSKAGLINRNGGKYSLKQLPG